jgi:hypothetical protein
VARLGPKDIQKMLADATEKLADTKDREVMDRLVASLPVTDITEWDRKLIGSLLAKAGMLDDCARVIRDIPSAWERADATQAVATALLDSNETEGGLQLLAEAVTQATSAQSESTDSDQQCASAILADASEIYALRGDFESSQKVVDAIVAPIRQQRALDRLKELRGDPPPEPESE